MPVSPPLPQAGAPCRIDGLLYLLGATSKIPNEARNGFLDVREVVRPDGTDEFEAAALKANYHYKKSIAFLESDLVWLDPDTWRADLREQAEALARSRPQTRVWCEEACEVQEATAPAEGFWALPGRHLLKPPVRYNPNPGPDGEPIGYQTFYPQDRDEARQLAEAILESGPCPTVPLIQEG